MGRAFPTPCQEFPDVIVGEQLDEYPCIWNCACSCICDLHTLFNYALVHQSHCQERRIQVFSIPYTIRIDLEIANTRFKNIESENSKYLHLSLEICKRWISNPPSIWHLFSRLFIPPRRVTGFHIPGFHPVQQGSQPLLG